MVTRGVSDLLEPELQAVEGRCGVRNWMEVFCKMFSAAMMPFRQFYANKVYYLDEIRQDFKTYYLTTLAQIKHNPNSKKIKFIKHIPMTWILGPDGFTRQF